MGMTFRKNTKQYSIVKQGRNQLGGRGGQPPPPVKVGPPPSKMWLYIVIAKPKMLETSVVIYSLLRLYICTYSVIFLQRLQGGNSPLA